MDQEILVKKLHQAIFSLQRYGHRKLPFLIHDPSAKEILSGHQKRDEEENTKTEPPSDERIDLRCFWAVEFYTPSQVAQLLLGFEKLGWNREGLTSSNPSLWIQRFRETSQAHCSWFSLGAIHRPDDKRLFLHGRTAPLPPYVDYALASMYSLTSSITCIVMCFIFDEKYSGRFDETLRQKYETVLEPIAGGGLFGGGYHVFSPRSQKKAAIQASRVEMRSSAANWFRTQLPGLFASGIMEDEFPTCEFVTLRKAQPFPKRDEGDHEPKEWLSLLDMDYGIDAWLAENSPGLKFAWPLLRDEKSRFHAVIAAREDAFPKEDLKAYPGGRESYIIYVRERVSGLLSRWALLCMLFRFERCLNNMRDSATLKPIKGGKPLYSLTEITGYLSQSMDIAAVSADLRHLVEQIALFEHELEIFKPCYPDYYRDKDITLGRMWREQIKERSVWIENIDRSARDLLIQYGTVIGSRENIKLQNRMGKLTWIMLILTILITALTALTAYIAVKTGNVSLPH
jgi:hypothetical protein